LTARGRRDDFAHHVFVAGASAVCTRRHEERPGAQAGGSAAAHEGWLAGGVFAQVFLGDLFPGIIGFGRFTASAIPLR
jgi:hypothetical protein